MIHPSVHPRIHRAAALACLLAVAAVTACDAEGPERMSSGPDDAVGGKADESDAAAPQADPPEHAGAIDACIREAYAAEDAVDILDWAARAAVNQAQVECLRQANALAVPLIETQLSRRSSEYATKTAGALEEWAKSHGGLCERFVAASETPQGDEATLLLAQCNAWAEGHLGRVLDVHAYLVIEPATDHWGSSERTTHAQCFGAYDSAMVVSTSDAVRAEATRDLAWCIEDASVEESDDIVAAIVASFPEREASREEVELEDWWAFRGQAVGKVCDAAAGTWFRDDDDRRDLKAAKCEVTAALLLADLVALTIPTI